MPALVIVVAMLSSGCTPSLAAATAVPPALIPYFTATDSPSPLAPAAGAVLENTPLPSPTPSQYTIRQGDTLSQIAERSRVTLDALLAANPQVNPNALRVGEVLHVPASPADFAGEGTPTPVAIPIREASCHPTADRGVWCFVLVTNDTTDMIENVTAQITLLDSAGAVLDSKLGVMPLDILPPGSSLPASALFIPLDPLDITVQVRILTGVRVFPGNDRYLEAEARNALARLSWSGRTAEVSGEVFIGPNGGDASSVWLVAVAYNRFGSVVGWRRWESSSGVAAGASQPFDLTVSSVAGRIEHLDFVVQARP